MKIKLRKEAREIARNTSKLSPRRIDRKEARTTSSLSEMNNNELIEQEVIEPK